MTESTLLDLNQISAGYGKMEVLHEVTLSINPGGLVTILGSNGVGKTTTLRTIMGQLPPNTGTITYLNQDITDTSPHGTAKLGISYCPEGRNVFGNLSVLENLRAGAYLINHSEFKSNLDEVFSMFPRLEERRNQISESLSGGEQQMLAMGRALISNPRLMLLDEPSLGLAPQLVELVRDTLVDVHSEGTSVLLVEQNAKLALDISDYGYVMEKGTFALEGESTKLKQEEKIRSTYLGMS